MLQKVKDRLGQLGYNASEGDESSLNFLIEKTDNFIKGYCNIEEVPEEVKSAEIDLICAEFLKDKALSGGLDGTFVTRMVESITEGDTSVSYSKGDAGSTITSFYNDTLNKLKLALAPFKRLRW